MKKFIAVIGTQNSGKSTIVKSLTGCKTTIWQNWVVDESNQNCIYVISGSPQELKLDQRISIERFNKILSDILNNKNSLGLVMTLQPKTPKRRHSMEEYFEAVYNSGLFEMYAFPLSPPRNNQNLDMNELRNRLDRFGSTIESLDARRFPYINASRIQATSNMIV